MKNEIMKNEKRMPKGWTLVKTNTSVSRNETKGKEQRVNRIVKNVRSKSYEDLKKDADAAYDAAEARKVSLLQAYEDKKLKSKALIKEAQAIKKAQAKAAEKAAKKNQKAAE